MEISEYPVYFKPDREYDTWDLLKDTSKDIRDDVAHFIYDDLMVAETEQVQRHGRLWHT